MDSKTNLEGDNLITKYSPCYENKISKVVIYPPTYSSNDESFVGMKYEVVTNEYFGNNCSEEFPTIVQNFTITEVGNYPDEGSDVTFKQNQGQNLESSNVLEKFACKLCSRTFTTRYSLNRHRRLLHNEGIQVEDIPYNTKSIKSKKFSCHHCNSLFTTKRSLIRHEKLIHVDSKKTLGNDPAEEEIYFEVPGVVEDETKDNDLKSYEATSHKPPNSQSESLSYKEVVKIQKQFQENQKTYVCCGKSFMYLTSLAMHQKNHKK
jgi:hypothetical protein